MCWGETACPIVKAGGGHWNGEGKDRKPKMAHCCMSLLRGNSIMRANPFLIFLCHSFAWQTAYFDNSCRKKVHPTPANQTHILTIYIYTSHFITVTSHHVHFSRGNFYWSAAYNKVIFQVIVVALIMNRMIISPGGIRHCISIEV